MNPFYLLTEHSLWFLPLCLAGGALFAWALYSKNPPWSKGWNWLLASLRFLTVSILLFLLLGPYLRYIKNSERKPVIVVAIDDSESVKLFSDTTRLRKLTSGLDGLKEQLGKEKAYQVDFRTVSGLKPESAGQIGFKGQMTNLDGPLHDIQSDYEGSNLAAVVVVSDGIINQGKSPLYSSFAFPIHTVALGDTTMRRDVMIGELHYNKVGYTGNKLPLEAEISQNGFNGQNVTVSLSEGGQVVERKPVSLSSSGNNKVSFQVTAGKPGKRHYVIQVSTLSGEFTPVNNIKHSYIDVIEGRVKILIAGAAPHPDIKAFKAALEKEDNLSVTTYLPNIEEFKPQDYDLVILHQIPNRLGLGTEVLNWAKGRTHGTLYVVGLQSDLNALRNLNPGLNINQNGNQTDQVTPVYSLDFSRFNLDSELEKRFAQAPPIEVPFGEYQLSPGMETVIRQQVGKLATAKPLLALQSNATARKGVWIGDGIWQWRIREFANHESTDAFDQLIKNTVQLLTVKENKKKLNVYPVNDAFAESDAVVFEADLYNEVYQKIYNLPFNLQLTHEDGSKRSFSFVNGQGSRFDLGTLKAGLWRYQANAKINNQLERDQGEFIVEARQLEALSSQADHNLLYQLSKQTKGKFYYPTQLSVLTKDLQQASYKPLLFSNEKLQELINQEWLMYLLLALLVAEWFIRRFQGGY